MLAEVGHQSRREQHPNSRTLRGMGWIPLSKRNDPEAAKEYDALHEGVPEWLAVPVAEWVFDVFTSMQNTKDFNHWIDVLFGMLRRPMPSGYDRIQSAIAVLSNEAAKGDLDVLDAVVWTSALSREGWQLRDRLELLLHVHGSAWTIGEDAADHPCLERRVDETVSTAAKSEMEQAGNASIHLRRAWHRVYGRNPDPGGAYKEAVRAVEAAAKPMITPKDPVATLGKMILAMDAKPEKWIAVLDGHGRGSGVRHVIEMCRALWTSQLDRHGTDDEAVRLDVSPAEAEAAVHLALTLVHWFRTEAVRLAHET